MYNIKSKAVQTKNWEEMSGGSVPSPVISRDITPGVITPIGINWLFLRFETTPFITSRGPPCVNKHDFSPRQIILRPPIPGQ